jgi:hypothetical protein
MSHGKVSQYAEAYRASGDWIDGAITAVTKGDLAAKRPSTSRA